MQNLSILYKSERNLLFTKVKSTVKQKIIQQKFEWFDILVNAFFKLLQNRLNSDIRKKYASM